MSSLLCEPPIANFGPPETPIRHAAISSLRSVDGARIEVKRVGVNLAERSRLGRRGVVDLGSLAPVVKELAEQYERLIDALGEKGYPVA